MKQLDIFDDAMRNFLDEIKTAWRKSIGEDGGNCPCCGKFGKIYGMKISQALAMSLKWISLQGDDWVDVQNKAPRWMLKSKTYPCLAYWNLIESKGKRSGFWKVTDKGYRFLNGEIQLPQKAYIYDNEVWEFSEETTSFRGCFGKKFNFDEMMTEQFDWVRYR